MKRKFDAFINSTIEDGTLESAMNENQKGDSSELVTIYSRAIEEGCETGFKRYLNENNIELDEKLSSIRTDFSYVRFSPRAKKPLSPVQIEQELRDTIMSIGTALYNPYMNCLNKHKKDPANESETMKLVVHTAKIVKEISYLLEEDQPDKLKQYINSLLSPIRNAASSGNVFATAILANGEDNLVKKMKSEGVFEVDNKVNDSRLPEYFSAALKEILSNNKDILDNLYSNIENQDEQGFYHSLGSLMSKLPHSNEDMIIEAYDHFENIYKQGLYRNSPVAISTGSLSSAGEASSMDIQETKTIEFIARIGNVFYDGEVAKEINKNSKLVENLNKSIDDFNMDKFNDCSSSLILNLTSSGLNTDNCQLVIEDLDIIARNLRDGKVFPDRSLPQIIAKSSMPSNLEASLRIDTSVKEGPSSVSEVISFNTGNSQWTDTVNRSKDNKKHNQSH
jgi:hypothetical protein